MGIPSSSGHVTNILQNHDFSEGLNSWRANCCTAIVVPSCASNLMEAAAIQAGNYAVATNRKEHWHGLVQDITENVSVGSVYSVSASVRVSGPLQGPADVIATLKLEYRDSATDFLFVGK